MGGDIISFIANLLASLVANFITNHFNRKN